MAKSARTSGKRGETHYNRKEKPATSDRTDGKREDRGTERARKPREDSGSKPYARRAASDRTDGKREDRGTERPRKPREDSDAKPYARRAASDRTERPAGRSSSGDGKPPRRDGDKPYERKPAGDRKPPRRDGDKPFERAPFGARKDSRTETGSDRPYKKPFRRDDGDRPAARGGDDKKPYARQTDRPSRDRDEQPAKRPYTKREESAGTDRDQPSSRKPFREKREDAGSGDRKKTFGDRKEGGARSSDRRPAGDRKPYDRKAGAAKPFPPKRTTFDGNEFVENTNPDKPGRWDTEVKSGPMTLNKYLAHSGVSSRRDAAGLIKEGKVQVNGKVLTEPGYRVQPEDVIIMDGKTMTPQRNFVYVLLNKPKDFLTTTEDDRGRRTVMELVAGATEDRLYPIGRLDRNTTGVLLLTNDGDLAQRLSHPRYESKKIYQVSLDKDVSKRDFDQIVEGVTLEDGPAKVDRLAYLDKKSEIGLEIHSGRNRIVRRIFESLGYEVEKLDRVMYAGLTKKNVSRGKWRFLSEKEVITLKHFRS